jgi:hypothetical protein
MVEVDGIPFSFCADASSALGSVDGSAITYPEAWTSTDLRYTVQVSGIKEDIILKDKSAPSSFRFVVNPGGLKPVTADRGIDFVDSSNNTQVRISGPVMYDANGEFSDAVDATWEAMPDGTIVLNVRPDEKWLATAAYPVTVDPMVVIGPASQVTDAYFAHYEYSSTGTWYTHQPPELPMPELWLGYNSLKFHSQHGCIQFDTSDIPSNATVSAASIDLYCCLISGSKQVEMRKLTQAWPANPFQTTGIYVARKTWTGNGTKTFDNDEVEAIVRDWVQNPSQNYGADWRGVPDGYYWDLRIWASGSNGPKLTVTYSAPLPAVSVEDDGVYTAHDSWLHATWSPYGAEYEPITGFQYAIGTARTDPPTTDVVNWQACSYANLDVIHTDLNLQDGQIYYFYMKAENGAGWSPVGFIGGVWKGVSDGITVDITAPTVTIDQASTQDDPTNGSVIDFTVVFSESVSDFANGDVTIGGTAGATTAVVTGSGTTYNVAVSGMTSCGTVTASIPSGVAHFSSTSSSILVTSDVW